MNHSTEKLTPNRFAATRGCLLRLDEDHETLGGSMATKAARHELTEAERALDAAKPDSQVSLLAAIYFWTKPEWAMESCVGEALRRLAQFDALLAAKETGRT